MRHRLGYRKLNRTSSHRKAMMVNMSISLLQHERIKTTVAKAKELRPFLEKLITKGKKGKCNKIRLFSVLRDKVIVDKLLNEVAIKFQDRYGGYLRIMKSGFRYGDCAPMAVIEFVDYNS